MWRSPTPCNRCTSWATKCPRARAEKGEGVRLDSSCSAQKPYCQAMGRSIFHWWYLVGENPCVITDNHRFGGGPDGYRDRVVFLMGVALS